MREERRKWREERRTRERTHRGRGGGMRNAHIRGEEDMHTYKGGRRERTRMRSTCVGEEGMHAQRTYKGRRERTCIRTPCMRGEKSI